MNTIQPKVLLSILCIAVIGIVGYLFWSKKNTPQEVACTMEAKQCPDGSYVSRQGPTCEFATCPGGSSLEAEIKMH
jgi:hypothetical protein